jgi:dihydrofolate reductase
MRKLVVKHVHVARRSHAGTGRPGGGSDRGFSLGGWSVNYFDEEMMERVTESGPYELLLGRGTYEIFAAHWPYCEGPIADQLNRTRNHVASRTLENVSWSNSTWSTTTFPGTSRRSRATTAPRSRCTAVPDSSKRYSSMA